MSMEYLLPVATPIRLSLFQEKDIRIYIAPHTIFRRPAYAIVCLGKGTSEKSHS